MKDATISLSIALLSLTVLTQSHLQGQGIHPRWSPDGDRLVTFERVRDSSTVQVWSPNDSIGRVVSSGAWFANPSWSPDQCRLAVAYGAHGMQGNWRLAIIDVKSGGLEILPDFPGREMHTSWSPDGNSIAFVINTGDGSDIHLIRPDGTGHRQVTETTNREFHPKWSPDGRQLTFDRVLGDGGGEIAVLDIVTGRVKVIELPDGVAGRTPSFHPDGQRVVFSYLRDNQGEIASIGVDGTEMQIHTSLGGYNGAPVWSPDGTTVAFHHSGAQEAGVYLLDMSSGVATILGAPPL